MRRIGLMGKLLGLMEGRFREIEGNCWNDGTLGQIKGKQLSLLAEITARSISKILMEKLM